MPESRDAADDSESRSDTDSDSGFDTDSKPGVDSGGGPPPGVRSAAPGAWYAFGVLFCMTLLDYMDRNVLSAVIPNLTADRASGGLGLTNAQTGSLATFFLVMYSVVSPAMGWAGDRYRRSRLLFAGVFVWSLATVGSAFATNYGQLALARCILGVGEATYGAIAPTLLLDLFPKRFRSRLLSYFYLAMPLGSALGIMVGGAVAQRHGWPNAFLVVGLPGLALAFLALTLPDPVRGGSEAVDEEELRVLASKRSTVADYLSLASNRSYVFATLAMAAYTFAIGGLLIWMPKFLIATRGIDQETATRNLGAITCVAAILGMTTGGWLADRLSRRTPRAPFLVPGVAMLAALPFAFAALLATRPATIYACVFCAETLMFINTGPCNAVIANVVVPYLRAAAYAISVFFLHFLGDVWSPLLIGALADHYGDPDRMTGTVGRYLAQLGAVPTAKLGNAAGATENILAGLLIVLPAIAVSGAIMLVGSKYLESDSRAARERAASAP